MFGLAPSLVRRARYVSSLLSTHNITRLLDEDMSAAETADLTQAEDVCRRFLAYDLSRKDNTSGLDCGDVRECLKDILARTEEPEDQDEASDEEANSTSCGPGEN